VDDVRKITVSALKIGRCYLTNTGRVWRIKQVMPDGRVLYEHRAQNLDSDNWAPGMLMKNTFPAEVMIVRQIPCDWTPEETGERQTPPCG
jgi:hypothetical protein